MCVTLSCGMLAALQAFNDGQALGAVLDAPYTRQRDLTSWVHDVAAPVQGEICIACLCTLCY